MFGETVGDIISIAIEPTPSWRITAVEASPDGGPPRYWCERVERPGTPRSDQIRVLMGHVAYNHTAAKRVSPATEQP